MGNKLLRRRAVTEVTGLPTSTIYRQMKEGNFPSPISLGGRTKAWIESEVDDWIAQRILQSRNKFN